MYNSSPLVPIRHQAIMWTNAGILLIGPLGTNSSQISIEMDIFSLKKNALENILRKMAAILSWPQVLNNSWFVSLAGQIDWSYIYILTSCIAFLYT